MLKRSRTVRALYVAAGFVFFAIGLLGVVLPVLPATPFMLLAAACFARGSERFYKWLLANRTFGPLIREWREHRSIPYRTKMFAIVLMSATLAASIVFFVKTLYLQLALTALGVLLAGWLWMIPSRDRR
jgi:uncharacterized membrane protein YbaN (DUF454 family)